MLLGKGNGRLFLGGLKVIALSTLRGEANLIKGLQFATTYL